MSWFTSTEHWRCDVCYYSYYNVVPTDTCCPINAPDSVTLCECVFSSIHFAQSDTSYVSDIFLSFQHRILGGDFYNKVCGHLKLLEKEYFGLEFRHHTGTYVSSLLLQHLQYLIDYCSSTYVSSLLLQPLCE